MNKVPRPPAPFGSKTRQQIADEYGWNVKTLRTKLRKLEIMLPPGLISPKWQKVIYEALGYPPGVKRNDYREI